MFYFLGFLFVAGLAFTAYFQQGVIKTYRQLRARQDAELADLRHNVVSLEGRLEIKTKDLKAATDKYLENSANFKAEIASLHNAVEKITNHYVNDSSKAICDSVTANNYETSVRKMERIFGIIRKFDIDFPASDEKQFTFRVKQAFEEAVRLDEAKQEQQRIKERIREEQAAIRERETEIHRAEREEALIQTALSKALAVANDKHSAEIESLKQQLIEAQEKTQRTKSQAELTKAGFVYVISNIGSFGEGKFKVGLTRRLEPMDRVKELGDASVPFPFDVHLMVSSQNAPELESSLHKELHKHRVNKVNMHKEFFQVSLETIIKAVEKCHGKVEYKAKPEAFEYVETLLINERGFQREYDAKEESPDEHEDDEVVA